MCEPTPKDRAGGALVIVVAFGAALGVLSLSVAVAGWLAVIACAMLTAAVMASALRAVISVERARERRAVAKAAVTVTVLPNVRPVPTPELTEAINDARDRHRLGEARPTIVASITSLPIEAAR
jgi:hypothetical protein